jgi:hypothetical protein
MNQRPQELQLELSSYFTVGCRSTALFGQVRLAREMLPRVDDDGDSRRHHQRGAWLCVIDAGLVVCELACCL